MSSLEQIRDALKSTIDGETAVELNVYDLVEDMGSLPAVIIEPNTCDFDGAMGRGMDVWDFNIYILVTRGASSSNGQELLDKLVSGAGPNSIRQILYENENLGLSDTTAHCYMMRAYGGSFDWARVEHVGAVLKVTVRTEAKS